MNGAHQKHHVIEIPVCGGDDAIQDHPLMEISESPGHLLLLKLWQRQEDLFARNIALKDLTLDSLRSQIFHLCLFFFTFHVFFFTILFTSTTSTNNNNDNSSSCQKWWLPMYVNLSTCCVMVFLVQMKLCRYWKVYAQMQTERNDSRALTRCVQELRMKGASFDLSKEPGNGKRIKKSSSVQIKWKPLTWCRRYFVTFCLVGAMGLAVPVSRFMLC